MMIRVCLLSVLIFVFSAVVHVSAAVSRFMDSYNITSYTMNDGMANNHIDDVYMDSKGFLWIAFIGGGLARFDGYEFVNFNENSSVIPIRSSFVSSITEDAFGRLWVAGECGVDVIDLATMSIVKPKDLTGKFYDKDNRLASMVTIDTTGALWLLVDDVVMRLTFSDEGDIVSVSSLYVGGDMHRGRVVRDVDSDGHVWIGLGDTVYKLRTDKNGNLEQVPVSKHLASLSDVYYFSDFVSKDGHVWISTNSGLYRYDPEGDAVKLYRSVDADDKTLSQNFLTDIAVTDNNRLIVSSLKGLNVYNPMTDTFERTFSSTHNLNNQFINMMLVAGDNIFIATEGGGLNILSPRRININILSHDTADPGSISNNPVNAIAYGPDGTLWIGIVEGGLNVRRTGESHFRHITTDSGILSHNSVSALAFDGMNRLWVGTWGGGIDVLSGDMPCYNLMQISPLSGYEHNITFVGAMIYDPVNKGMFIGANEGVLFYDCENGELSVAIKPGPGYGAFGFIGALIDSHDRLWMGSAGGLLIIDLHKRLEDGSFAYEYKRHLVDDSDDAGMERPTCFYEDGDGLMWIGTNGRGIYKSVIKDDVNEMTFVNVSTTDGLTNNSVRGIAGDESGNIWISTLNGLSRYNKENKFFYNYKESDGLPDNQFYWNASCIEPDGDIMFGTTKGVAEILSDNGDDGPERMPVVFTRLSLDNRYVAGPDPDILDQDIAYADRIDIHEGVKSVNLEFSALDYARKSEALYCYRLKGFDQDWIVVDNNRRWAGYTNLSPGSYVFQVKYVPDGNFDDAPVTELRVRVIPYFYKTPWFIALIAIVFIVLIIAAYKHRIHGLEQQRRYLKAEIDSSTAQLAEQKELVEHRANELAERNEQLTVRNVEISRQKQQLTEMNRLVQEMTVDRLSFFTNITHEFRTPITLIIGPIERALKLSTNPKVVEQLQLVERNSKYLLSLVNQLMDFRKVESGKMEIMTTVGNFRMYINDIVKPFEAAASDRNITLRCVMKLKCDEFAYDGESLRKILVNLLSNAIKYTPDGGKITLYAACCDSVAPSYGDDAVGTLYIGVSDSGSGIAADDIDHIFDRFYQGDSKLKYPFGGAGDSGIGLFLCRSIVEVYGGSITVRNNHREGCTFRVLLPVTKTCQPGNETVDSIEPHDEPSGESGGTRPTILVVEDNEDMRKFIYTILTDKYNVIEAGNGAEGLEKLLVTSVDLVVSDVMMPVMDGIEFSRRVKENFSISHIPFIMLTAKTSKESRIESYRIGVDDYLLKPFDERVLLARVDGILRNRRRLQHNFNESMDVEVLDLASESRDKKFIDQVMETIKNNYRNSYFEVGDFADALGISRSLLNKKLQSLMGQSAGQLIRNYRLNMARELILKNRETRAMNISEIAYEVGFNDSKYFTRCFTKQYNITPSSMLGSK